ncbi:hypothetical protein Bca101_037020 [Brassica carinata]
MLKTPLPPGDKSRRRRCYESHNFPEAKPDVHHIGRNDATPESKTGREHRNWYTKTTDSLSHKSTLNFLKDDFLIRRLEH